MDQLGDIAMSTPAFSAIRDIFAHSSVTVLASEMSKELVEVMPVFNRIIYFDAPWFVKGKKHGCRRLLAIIKELRRENFDLVVDLRGDFRNNVFMYFCNARYRVGYDITGCQFFLTHIVPLGEDHHPVSMGLSLARYLEPESKKLYKMSLWITEQDREFAVDFLEQNGIAAGSDRPTVVMHPGARWAGRQWTPEGYARIANRLIENYDANVIICGSGNEIKLADEIKSLMTREPVIAAGKTSLRQFLALLEKSNLFIGLDSGPMHMAVAMGVKVVALFGAARPESVGPYGEGHIVVTKQQLYSCSPCSQTVCKRPDASCMQAITIEEVWNAVEVQLQRLFFEKAGD
jgi:lipopolysaccharide heptosyltransferase II